MRYHPVLLWVLATLTVGTPVAWSAEPEILEPSSYRLEDYNKPVPKTLVGVKAVVNADQAKALLNAGTAVLIDVHPRAPKPANLPASTVWREPPHRSVKGAIWLPNVGFGALSPAVQSYFASHLTRLTGGDKSKPVVLFCLRDCWMSWNASKRAMELGYTNVYWFSEGTDAWEEAGYELAIVDPVL